MSLKVGLLFSFVMILKVIEGLYECPVVEKLMETKDESFRYPYYTISNKSYFGYKDAADFCRQCFDADLITNLKSLQLSSYKLFIGVYRDARSPDWKWANHLRVENWKEHVTKFKQENLTTTSSYGVVAEPHLWTAVPNVPIEQDCKKNRDLYGGIDKIICQRSVTNECHMWNYTEPHCIYAKQYGCYKVVATHKRYGDDAKSYKCTSPLIVYSAEQCPAKECKCDLTEWSEWSDCTARNCDGGVRMQQRKLTTPKCYFIEKYELERKENCTIIGCDKLVDEHEFNDLFLLT